jgi:hypothetical protein
VPSSVVTAAGGDMKAGRRKSLPASAVLQGGGDADAGSVQANSGAENEAGVVPDPAADRRERLPS